MVDWIIGIGVAVLVVLIIRQQFRKKRNGQSGWMRRLQWLCQNLSDGQKRSELTVERRREYNKK